MRGSTRHVQTRQCQSCGLEFTEVTRINLLTRRPLDTVIHSPRTGHSVDASEGVAECECGADVYHRAEVAA